MRTARRTHHRETRQWVALLTVALGGCSLLVDAGSYSEGDGERDAAVMDAGTADAGATDAGATDAGVMDGGAPACEPTCASGQRCVDGTCVTTCNCAAGQICLAGGGCVSPGDCSSPPEPSCEGESATSGELTPMRVAVLPFAAAPTDLHVAEDPLGPGWLMFWRNPDGEVRLAAASVHSEASGTCHEARLLGSLEVCADVRTISTDLLDVRTIYDSTGNPLTHVATTYQDPTEIIVWTLQAPPGHRSPICARLSTNWEDDDNTFSSVDAISIAPNQAQAIVYAAVTTTGTSTTGTSFAAKLTSSGLSLLFAGSNRILATGDVAADHIVTAFQEGSALNVWNGTNVRRPSTGALAPGLVAAVNPANFNSSDRSPSLFFAVQPGTPNKLKAVSCNRVGCSSQDTAWSSVSPVRGSPIAAYRYRPEPDEETRVITVEDSDAGLKLVRHAPSETVGVPGRSELLLDGPIVGGPIMQVHALDAEVLRDMSSSSPPVEVGQLHVWAAFITVMRDGGPQLELWTGAYRRCLPADG